MSLRTIPDLRRLVRSLPLLFGLWAVGVGGPADAGNEPPPAPQTGQLRPPNYPVVLTPDGRRVIGVDDSFSVRVWDASTCALIETRQLPGPPHPGPPYGKVYLSRDGSRLASVQRETLEFWDVAAGVRLRTVPRLAPVVSGRGGTVRGGAVQPAPVYGGSFAPDGQTFAAGEQAELSKFVLGLYDLRTGSRRTITEQTGTIANPVFSPDGKRIAATAFKASRLYVWSVASGNELWHSSETSDRPAWSPDGRWLAVYEVRSGGKLWDADNGHEAPFPMPESRSGYRFGPDSRTLVYRTNDDLVFWDLTAGRATQTIRGAGIPFAFAPDGRSFYTWGLDQVLQRWDIATGKLLFPEARD